LLYFLQSDKYVTTIHYCWIAINIIKNSILYHNMNILYHNMNILYHNMNILYHNMNILSTIL